MPARFTRLSGSSAFSVPNRAALVTIMSVSPMMALSGVRNSWLTLETNCDLYSLACCSCRFLSWISSNSRTFSIAITAWSAKVVTSSICFVGKWLRHSSRYEDHPNDLFLAQEWNAERRSVAANLLGIMSVIFRIGQHVCNMNNSTFERRSADNSTSIYRYWMVFRVFLKFRRKSVARGSTKEIAVA